MGTQSVNLTDLEFGPGDYRREVYYTLAIDARGKVRKCRITKGSGDELFDKSFCREIKKSSQFDQADGSSFNRGTRELKGSFYSDPPRELPSGVTVETELVTKRIAADDDSFRDYYQAQLAERPRDPVPKTNPASWFGAEMLSADYRGVVAATAFRIRVGEAGVPVGCEVLSSSGSKKLDQAVCDSLMERAKFDPALDGDGNAVEGLYESEMRMRPVEYFAP